MASRVLRPVDRSLIDLSGLSSGGVATVFLARRIDVSAFTELVAYWRYHPGTSANLTAASFIIHNDGYTSEDPGALNASNQPAFQVPLVTTDVKNTAVGGMFVVPVSQFGSLLSLSLTATAAAVTTHRLIVSIDLTCKEF